MSRTFDRMLGLYYWLKPIMATPAERRTVWQRMTVRLLAGRLRRAMFKRNVAFFPAEAHLGPGATFGHEGFGVVISAEARIGANVTIMQNVTIGANVGAGREREAPVIGDNVFIGANACIIGRCTIGDGAKIGAGVTLVNVAVPARAVIVNRSAYDLTNGRFVHDQGEELAASSTTSNA